MDLSRPKVLILSGHDAANATLVETLRKLSDVTEAGTIDQAVEELRQGHFSAIFSDSSDFLPLERALVSQQANLILNTIGEGVCIVDGEGRCNWMNKKMQAWPARVHEKIRRTCQDAFEIFSKQVSPAVNTAPSPSDIPLYLARSKRYALTIEDQQYLEMIASPVISPAGAVVPERIRTLGRDRSTE